ncbi:MAG: 16S rRNA (cytosine(1402)-N(4))-methyltransferase RsmH [Rikenellaceae bacterium]
MSLYHIPALLSETIKGLDIKKNGTYVDLTFGGGGHSSAILAELDKGGKLYSFDQDIDAKQNILGDDKFCFIHSNFRFMRSQLRVRGVEGVDGILADLGVSFHHFDVAERGFSFRFDAPLDMRMNQKSSFSAYNVINEYDHKSLLTIFRDYGELSQPHKIAGAIQRARLEAPITTTFELLQAVKCVTPPKDESKFNAKLFQAIRIEVNREMEALKMMLEQSAKILNSGGVFAVITYHSLEDRLVKNFFRSGNFEGKIESDIYGNSSSIFERASKVITASKDEVERNPRSRSAKLRLVKKK